MNEPGTTATGRGSQPLRKAARDARERIRLTWLPRVAIAVGTSLLLWLYVAATSEPNRPNTTRYPAVAVRILNQDGGLVLAGDAPTVSVLVRDRSGSLDAGDGAPQVYIDLAGRGEGAQLIPVQVRDGGGGDVLSVQPAQVRVVLELAASVTLPVRVLPAPGDDPESLPDGLVVEPGRVTVVGSGREVERIRVLRVDVSAEELPPGSSRTLPVLAVDRAGRPVDAERIDPPEVTVTRPTRGAPSPSPRE